MRILVVSQYFWPESFRINDLVEAWVSRGHRVTVLTGIPNYPSGRFFDGYGWFRRSREQYAGAKVVRVPLLARGNGGGISLTLNYLSFALLASLLGPLKLGTGYDVIFVHEPSPITVGLPAIAMKLVCGAPIVLWVLDLWPESVAAAGAVRSKLLLGLLDRLVRLIYRRCDKLLVSSRAFIPKVTAQGVPRERIHYFPNWAEPVFAPCSRDISPPAELPSGFRIMFAGNVGTSQDFPSILGAAELLKSNTDIHWLVLGEGRMLQWVRNETAARGLSNVVHLLGRHSIDAMPAFFAHADVMLVSLTSDAIFSLTVPAKLQAYLACGKPVLCMLDGEGARIVEEAGAGVCCRTQSPAALAAAVLKLKTMNAQQRDRLGANGLRYSQTEFSREGLIDRLEHWLAEAADRNAL